ncbi:sensor histidine kinase [Lachnoclostridium sp. An118]|uniref:sensor histidine kinase n=1 Tax=Lachnoclostridium sp. An118 TaxID=1965547 RepID=UPI000B3823DB|nr:HAMP domain-containing sensor histidine kinase [Lachnoclostridium sp. An118]OUQ49096.1 histidine kinase [Lachnoclostridium sp. An118]
MWMWIAAGAVLGAGASSALVLYIQRRRRAAELEELAGLVRDVLDDREIEEKAAGEETLYGRIEHMLVRIQRMNRGRQEELTESRSRVQKLITEIAHQMRTPLANGGTYLELLEGELSEREDPVADPVPMYLEALRSSQEKLRFLTEEFIRISRLENNIIRIRKEERDIAGTIGDALAQVRPMAEEKGVRISEHLPEGLSCPHDPGWFGEALWNVLDNAVKYSQEGGRIWVEASRGELYLTIRVADEGIGIDEGEEARVFQRFYRGRRTASYEGLGVGLYLAREITARHGGFMEIQRRDPGVEVRVCLPIGFGEI